MFRPFRVWAATVAAVLSLSSVASCYPQLQAEFSKRQIGCRNLKDSYDYIVIGGGQSGLVVANRLSEDPDATVLIVEYGYFDDRPMVLQPQSATSYPRQDLFNVTSVPQKGLGGSRQAVYAACVVGGGSTINGMMLNRGAADDYDNWEKLNNPGWGFNDLLPYFVKSTRFDAPAPQLQKEFNITWNESSYGSDGPIHVSYAPFQWPGVKIQYQGLVEAGAEPQLDGADGHAYGVFWYTSAVDNATVTRSYARNQYYDPVANRENLQILTGWRVNDITFDENKHATGIRMQKRGTEAGAQVITVKSKKEIVLTAGALHSPQVLQRSGIGPAALLEKAKIDVVVDLPGVGSNLQDHAVSGFSYRYTTDVEPNPTTTQAQNKTFAEWVQKEWKENRSGPMSQTTGNTAGLLPLKVVSPDRWEEIVAAYRAQNAADFLPGTYTAEQVRGYEAQRAILSDSMTRTDNAVVELPIQGTGSGALVLTKEVSRGTVLLDPADIYADPVLDYQTFVNPVDAAIAVENVRFARRLQQTPSVRALGPVEQVPGANVTSDEALLAVVRSSSGSSTAHISGTCAMMPREYGGVVDSELRVYGVGGLSVADSSIQPLIPGAHICATVYAVAEKAADLIKARHR